MKFEEIIGIKLNESGLLDIPQHIKRIKFDVGLSWCAPNSAAWLQMDKEKELFVIGIEANRFACQRIGNKVLNPHPPYENCIIDNNNYMLINCAIDDVSNLEMKTFYHVAGDPGTSSLLKPTPILKVDIEEISEVPTIPLSFILEKIPWNRFEFIEHMKTDTQGKDLEVVLSAGDYLDKIVYLDCEVSTSGCYENENDVHMIINKIINRGFKVLSAGGPNASFVNIKLEHLIKKYNLNNYTCNN